MAPIPSISAAKNMSGISPFKRVADMGVAFLSDVPISREEAWGVVLDNPPRKSVSSSPPRQSSASMIVNTRVVLLRSAGSSEPNSILAS